MTGRGREGRKDRKRGWRLGNEQLLYADILAVGMYTGLGLLLLTFGLYISGAIDPAIPIERLPEYWTMAAGDYLKSINAQHLHNGEALAGWWWLSALGKGDCLCFVGIAVLASVTIVCFIGILPTLLWKRDMIYMAIALIEVAVLALAASGLLQPGAHG